MTTDTDKTLAMLAEAVDTAARERATSQVKRALAEVETLRMHLTGYCDHAEQITINDAQGRLFNALHAAAERRARSILRSRITEAARSALREG